LTRRSNDNNAGASNASDSKAIVSLPELDTVESSSSSSTTPASQWQIALAAAAASAGLVFWIWSFNGSVALVTFVLVFGLAVRDPLEDDSVWGALARLVGRQTISSYQASQPKLQALARAVVTGEEEIVALQLQLQALQQENQALQQWKQIRLEAEDSLGDYTVPQLKEELRQAQLPVSGTKLQLLTRLLEYQYQQQQPTNFKSK